MLNPFGFDFEVCLSDVPTRSVLLDETHALDNPVLGFKDGAPVFTYPKGKLDVMFEHGTRIKILHRNRTKMMATAALHTPHTISLKKAAFDILDTLRKQPRVRWNSNGDTFYDVRLDASPPLLRHKDRMQLFRNARHLGRRVVLKTTQDPALMLRYILEAVIQTLVYRKCPESVPAPTLVGLTDDDRLVCASEELLTPSVTDFIRTVPTTAQLLYMSRQFCEMMMRVQAVGCTHRDTHTSNVYVDPKTLRTRLIDFDWSAIQHGQTVLSVPRHLYDSTRGLYGRNRSVDCCIFFRSLQSQLAGKQAVADYYKAFLGPLMQLYEDECRARLTGAHDIASQQLYRVASSTGGLHGEYGHAHGLSRLATDFDYEMGYYEWQTMRPEAILKYIQQI